MLIGTIDVGPLAPWIAIGIALAMLWTARKLLRIAHDQREIARRQEERAIHQEKQEELLSKKQTSAEETPVQQDGSR